MSWHFLSLSTYISSWNLFHWPIWYLCSSLLQYSPLFRCQCCRILESIEIEWNGTKCVNVNPITHVQIYSIPYFHTPKLVKFFLRDFKSFQVKVPFLYPLKTSENLWSTNLIFMCTDFRVHKTVTEGTNLHRLIHNVLIDIAFPI